MKFEVLLATMFFEKENENFLENFNLQSDLIVGNQTDCDLDERFTHCGYSVRVISRTDRGVGKNRNRALNASQADIVIFADNDVRYYDGYAQKVERFYTDHPDADLVIFNFKEKRGDEPLHNINTQNKIAGLKDITKFGTWAVTAKRESILENGIQFSPLFGGGAKYGCGEDSLFLADCCKRGLRIYLCSDTLGEVVHRESTWYTGITDKYVFDKGALFRAMCPKIWRIAVLRHVLKHRAAYAEFGSIGLVVRRMCAGAKDYVQACAGVE